MLYCALVQVMDKDTLNGIALKFDTTPGKIASLNKFSLSVSASILPGQVSGKFVAPKLCECSLVEVFNNS